MLQGMLAPHTPRCAATNGMPFSRIFSAIGRLKFILFPSFCLSRGRAARISKGAPQLCIFSLLFESRSSPCFLLRRGAHLFYAFACALALYYIMNPADCKCLKCCKIPFSARFLGVFGSLQGRAIRQPFNISKPKIDDYRLQILLSQIILFIASDNDFHIFRKQISRII